MKIREGVLHFVITSIPSATIRSAPFVIIEALVSAPSIEALVSAPFIVLPIFLMDHRTIAPQFRIIREVMVMLIIVILGGIDLISRRSNRKGSNLPIGWLLSTWRGRLSQDTSDITGVSIR